MQPQYFVIDQKSYYATVECVARGLDPMKTNLVVADPDRSQNTICLAVSPSMKALGVKNRCRIRDIPGNIKYIVAPPRMQLYIDCAAEIHGVFLKHFAPQDIYTYSIDESFIDATPYLKMYNISSRELAKRVIDDVHDTVGTISTCGIGTNMFLAKVALDIQAKHAPDFIAELNETQYREQLWDHKPITDFWGIGPGTAKRLWDRGITTMGGIAQCELNRIYDWFGIDGELLHDHAWGREPTTIADIKAYKSKAKSLSSSQVLMRDYKYSEAEIIAKDDKFRLISANKRESLSINLGRIQQCFMLEPCEDADYRPKPMKKRILVLELTDDRNALERVMLHFSHLDKETERIDDTHYKITLFYEKEDETELLIRVLSFGPVLKVVFPDDFVKKLTERLEKQKKLRIQT